jgi:Bacterial Ig domain
MFHKSSPAFVLLKTLAFYCLCGVGFGLVEAQVIANVTVSLAWDANSEADLAGYRVRFGTKPRTYTHVLDVGKKTISSVGNLSAGVTYFFAVTAYNTAGLESAPSNEVSVVAGTKAEIPPTVKPLPPVERNEPPAVNLTLPTNRTYTAPADVVMNASASDSDGSVTRVEFYQGTVKIGEVTSSPYAFTWRNVPAGSYTIAARAIDDLGASTNSSSISVPIAKNRAPSVRLTSPSNEIVGKSNGIVVNSRAGITLAAAATDQDGKIVRVDFFEGKTKVAEVRNSPFEFQWEGRIPGVYHFTVVAWDDAGNSSVSKEVLVRVKRLSIDATRRLPDGSFEFSVAGAPGRTNTVEISSDLAIWTPAFEFVNTTGTEILKDTESATLASNFYRVVDGSATSDPAGFMTIVVPGSRTRNSTPAPSLLAISLLSPVSYEGAITSPGPSSITDTRAEWTQHQFDPGAGEFFIEITSGPNAGLVSDIITVDSGRKVITLNEDLSPYLSGGESYQIRRHRTIADIFGRDNEAGLLGAEIGSRADEIGIWNPHTQQFTTFYYKTGGFGGRGWRTASDPIADASNTRLYFDQGILLNRRSDGILKLVLNGAVKTGLTAIPLVSGTNLVANVFPARGMTLENSGLFTGNQRTGLAAAATIKTADEVQIFDGTKIRRFFYRKTGKGADGWRIFGNTTSLAGSTPIPPGSSMYILRKHGRSGLMWTVRPPLTIGTK